MVASLLSGWQEMKCKCETLLHKNARSHDSDNRNVALKISATEGGQGSNEHNILTSVVKVQNTLHTEGHIVRLLDSFHGTGPNGNYLCTVFEPLG